MPRLLFTGQTFLRLIASLDRILMINRNFVVVLLMDDSVVVIRERIAANLTEALENFGRPNGAVFQA